MENQSEDFIAFEGSTLEEAYKKASLEFDCSITDLKCEIMQAPSSGFLGFFRKSAIIKVYKCKKNSYENKQESHKNQHNTSINIKDISSQMEDMHNNETHSGSVDVKKGTLKKEDKIFNSFYEKDHSDYEEIKIIKDDTILKEIKEKVDELFSHLAYDIDPVTVSYYDENTVFIGFTGNDSALLIGKEGYRYKALSYILFNWIHEKYDLMIRLEIAEFLTTQEESIHRYLEPVIETIKIDGFYKTKNLDGILIHIALTRLRGEFPEKYIAVKSNIKGEKYILVNEYRK